MATHLVQQVLDELKSAEEEGRWLQYDDFLKEWEMIETICSKTPAHARAWDNLCTEFYKAKGDISDCVVEIQKFAESVNVVC